MKFYDKINGIFNSSKNTDTPEISAKLNGILNSPSEKRYKSFISTTADSSEVWLLKDKHGYATIDFDGFINLLVFPSEEFAVWFRDLQFRKDTLECLDVHEFLERCEELLSQEEIRFFVSPNEKDGFIVSAEKMLADLTEELELIE